MSNLYTKSLKLCGGSLLVKIYRLFLCGNIGRANDLVLNFFFDKMPVHLNVFDSIMLNWVEENVDGNFVITVDSEWNF